MVVPPRLGDSPDILVVNAVAEEAVEAGYERVLDVFGLKLRGVHHAALDHHVGLCVVRRALVGVFHMQPQGFGLVAVAYAVAAHVLEHGVVLECHHREVVVVVHKGAHVALVGHIDRE